MPRPAIFNLRQRPSGVAAPALSHQSLATSATNTFLHPSKAPLAFANCRTAPASVNWHFIIRIPGSPTAVRPLDQLQQTIDLRKAEGDAAKSYTAKLLAGGIEAIGAKVIEEAGEVVEAAGQADAAGRDHTIAEAADVVYHLLVLLAARDASLTDVEQKLAERFGLSGLEEKRARSSQP